MYFYSDRTVDNKKRIAKIEIRLKLYYYLCYFLSGRQAINRHGLSFSYAERNCFVIKGMGKAFLFRIRFVQM